MAKELVYCDLVPCDLTSGIPIDYNAIILVKAFKKFGVNYYGITRHDEYLNLKEMSLLGQDLSLSLFNDFCIGNYDYKNNCIKLLTQECDDNLFMSAREPMLSYTKLDFDGSTYEKWQMPNLKGTTATKKSHGVIVNETFI